MQTPIELAAEPDLPPRHRAAHPDGRCLTNGAFPLAIGVGALSSNVVREENGVQFRPKLTPLPPSFFESATVVIRPNQFDREFPVERVCQVERYCYLANRAAESGNVDMESTPLVFASGIETAVLLFNSKGLKSTKPLRKTNVFVSHSARPAAIEISVRRIGDAPAQAGGVMRMAAGFRRAL